MQHKRTIDKRRSENKSFGMLKSTKDWMESTSENIKKAARSHEPLKNLTRAGMSPSNTEAHENCWLQPKRLTATRELKTH